MLLLKEVENMVVNQNGTVPLQYMNTVVDRLDTTLSSVGNQLVFSGLSKSVYVPIAQFAFWCLGFNLIVGGFLCTHN